MNNNPSKYSLWLARVFCVIILVILSRKAFCQKEYNMWYFGYKAGINFNTNPPTPLLNNKLYTSEASSGICDANGDLLFYTNGDTIMNRLHQPMKNGILNPDFWIFSATQGAMVVPVPGSNHLYYLFSPRASEKMSINGYFRYSVIDMDGDAGFGAVKVSHKRLFPKSNESLALTLHANNLDYWVATVNMNTGYFNAIRTVNGNIDSTIYTQKLKNAKGSYYGQIKFSPDSKILSEFNTVFSPDTFLLNLYKFDNSTGNLNSLISLPLYNDIWSFNEFSPNSRYIYVKQSKRGYPQLEKIIQLDLAIWNKDSILKSAKIIFSRKSNLVYGLQLGPDGKIYVFQNSAKISVIHSPDSIAPTCTFKENDFDLGGRKNSSGCPYYPSFKFKKLKKPNLGNDTIICKGDSITLQANAFFNSKLKWSTGDNSKSIIVKKPGIYWVQLYNERDTVSDTITISFSKKFKVYLGPDTAFCGKFTHLLNAGKGFKKYNWSTGDTTVSILIDKPDWYSVTIKDSFNCAAGDTILVEQLMSPLIKLNYDSITCKYIYFSAKADTNAIKYLWNTGDSGVTIKVDKKGTYRLTASNKFCDISSDILVDKLPLAFINIGKDTIVCGKELILTCAGGNSYLWNTGEQAVSIKVRKDGFYWVTATENKCSVTDSITVKFDCDTMSYFIPNAFSPNGDKDNDVFKVFGTNIDQIEIIIFDRWGEKLIETSGKEPYWDGTYKNALCQQSAYFYMVTLKGKKPGSTKYLKGTVTLLR